MSGERESPTFAFPSVTALNSVDFPADGFPTQPIINSQPGMKVIVAFFPHIELCVLWCDEQCEYGVYDSSLDGTSMECSVTLPMCFRLYARAIRERGRAILEKGRGILRFPLFFLVIERPIPCFRLSVFVEPNQSFQIRRLPSSPAPKELLRSFSAVSLFH